MKRIIYTLLIGLVFMAKALGQPYNLTLNLPETGPQLHQATNSIILAAGYSYTPAGGTMLSEIVDPYVNGSIFYNQTIVDPATRTLNTSPSYLVGATKGAFNVTPSGGASYSIPIDLLPGVNGLAPSLSLVYSSNSGPGVAGFGWQIGGISVISRSPQNYYNDNAVTAIDLTANDKFSLDGQRLVLTNGTYGAHLANYQTEIDEFTRVQSQYTSGSGPEKFIAQTKSGLKNLYGFNDDGRQRIIGYNEVLNWYLTETSDLYGNVISYKYMRNHSMVYPAEINYGPNKITFSYKERNDVTISYLKGQKIEQQLLLEKITVSYNNNVVKTYDLKYNYLLNNYYGCSVLNEVIESGTGGSSLNSTAFSYQEPENAAFGLLSGPFSHVISNIDISANSILFPGDFNGDGYKDILTLDKSTQTITKLYINDKRGGFKLSDQKTGAFSIGDIVISDLNGDNMDDFIIIGYKDGHINYNWMISDGSKFGVPHSFLNLYSEYKKVFDDINNRSSDFDGDGFEDFLVVTKNSNAWEMYSFTPSTINTTFVQNNRSGTVPSWGDKIYLADFNGDGKTDIWSFDSNGLIIYSLSGLSLIQIYPSNSPNLNIVNKDHHFEIGDFNGDGKSDIFIYGYSSNDGDVWKTEISTGIGFEEHSFSSKKTNLKDDKVYAVDINGDGRTDIMSASKSGTSSLYNNYFFSNLNGTELFNESSDQTVFDQLSIYALGDYNGDGKVDVLVTAGNFGYYMGYTGGSKSNDRTNYFLLKRAGDGLGNITSINYTKLTDTLSYSKGNEVLNFPLFKFQGVMPMVNSVSMSNGIGGTNSLTYSYEGAKIHRKGKGFLGFSKFTETDAMSGLFTETQSGYNSTYYYPQVNTVTKKTTSGSIIETTSNTWTQTILDAPTKRIFPYVESSTYTNVLNNNSVNTTIASYDSFGNPGKITKTFKTGTVDDGNQSITNLYQSENITAWLLGRQTQTTTTYSRGGEIINNIISREFSQTTNRDTAEVQFAGTDKSIRYSHVYYPNGNLKKEMLQSGGISRSTSYTYNSDNVRVSTIKDPLGHITTRNYFSTDGLLSDQTDYLNNKNSFTYDGLGEKLTQTQWDGLVTTNTYKWDINTINNSVYNITSKGNDGSASTTWYDKLNREIRLDVLGFDGTYIYKATNYNPKGQVEQVSEPSTTINPLQWSKFTYLSNGRLQKIEKPTGSITTYDYLNNKVTINIDGKSSWKETDSQGLVSIAHDNGGDIIYEYYPDGKAKTITAPGGAITRMEYNDAPRNQTKLTDPSSGVINYTYDSFGNVITQNDARNRLTTYKYYPDGRINTKVIPEGTTTYAYNTNKQLTGISQPNAVSRTCGYDTQGRVTSISETISGRPTPFLTSYVFDIYGRLSTLTHPSGITETRGYNDYGYMKTISAGGSIRYTVTGMNARQQITAATYGSNLTATYGFDAYGYPNSTVTGSVQNYGYSFNPVTGNLNWRKNVNRSNITESFSYTDNGDNLDRLTGVTGPQNLSMTYTANGNIMTKSDIGTTSFGYGTNAGPYALTGVTSPTNIIPAGRQDISYNSFGKISSIIEPNGSQSINAFFTYNSDNQRAKMFVGVYYGAEIMTRYYVGGSYMLEVQPNTSNEYTYLGGDAYTAPVVVHNDRGVVSYYYLLRDYLGNITHQVNTSNTVKAEYSFDAWGRRRNATNWTYILDANDKALFADRGFTGHEYLSWFKLYNMNGRMYDPLVGRFLNPDPYVQMPDNTQNFNRYSYCLNNPLKYNDPNGEIIFTALALIFCPPLLPFAIAADLSWMTDYSIQVGMNYASGKRGADAWLKNVDWFDIGVSAVTGGATGGFTAEYKVLKNGEKLSRLGVWVLKNKIWIRMGEIALTTAVDITGDGVQKVSSDDFIKRFSINMATLGVQELASDYLSKLVKNSESQIAKTANQIGKEGEDAVGITGPKTRILVNGRIRIPDALNGTTLTEVKNVKALCLTKQLKDFLIYSKQEGLDFLLYTRPGTTFSGPLQNAIRNRDIIWKAIP